MSEGNVFVTVVSGTAVYVLGQIVVRLFCEPVFRFREARGRIASEMVLWAQFYANPGTGEESAINGASKALRENAALLSGSYSAIPFKRLFSLVHLVPKKEDANIAIKSIVGLSNSLHSKGFEAVKHNIEREELIYKALKIERVT